MTTPNATLANDQRLSSNDSGNNIIDDDLRITENNLRNARNGSSSLNDTSININMHRVETQIRTADINTTITNRQPATVNNTNDTTTLYSVQDIQPVDCYDDNRLSTLEKNLMLNQKTLDHLKEKIKQRYHYRSSMKSKISEYGTLVRDNRLSLSSLDISANINVMESLNRKRKTLHETETGSDKPEKVTQHAKCDRKILWGNAGLQNQSVICYSNAIFQAIASCNHLTTLFNDILRDNQKCFKMNYEFVRLLNLMMCQSDCIDPGNFVKLFTDYHQQFKDEECTYY